MKKSIFILLFLLPIVFHAQSSKDFKRYREIVELINKNQLKEAKQKTHKLLDKNKNWKKKI